MSEESKVIESERTSNAEIIAAFNKIPYALINTEVEGTAKETLDEFTRIAQYYQIYKKGAKFNVEGTNGDYVPAMLHYKMVYTLINKEVRFLFAESPDIVVETKGDLGKTSDESKNAITILNDLVKTILDKNKFELNLIKAAKDCFIGKRVAGIVNWNEDEGVTVQFLPATQFIYDTQMGNENILTKFVAFIVIKDTKSQSDKRIFKKKYILEDDGKVYLEEALYDGTGKLIEDITEYQETKLAFIPAVIFTNDGLLDDDLGESEVELLADTESWYSKLSNGDIDSLRKNMNPVKYTIDMDSNSTKGLKSSAGAYWDLGSDQNLEKSNPSVGILESSMNYSESLKKSLDRIKTAGYEQIDMPNITLESLQGAITSGKSLKAIYWALIVRCKEKMKMWGPQLMSLIDILIQGSLLYPNCITQYTNDTLVPVDYEIKVEQNTPLPEDEAEERTMDLAEIESKAMSRKAYMKKWRGLTDDEVTDELNQIALEQQLLEDSAFSNKSFENTSDEDTPDNSLEEIE